MNAVNPTVPTTVPKMRKADFFLIGGSNSGTTALSRWLRAHPDVCFSTPKGPGYFSPDLKGYNYIKDLAAYEACFADIDEGTKLVGEGSTWYIFSDVAVPAILEYNPDAKFIVILRNPIEHVRSFHNTLYHQASENLEDFRAAWDAQEDRRNGRRIPASCLEPSFLQYGRFSAFGWQVERLFKRVARDKVLVLIYDDHVATPEKTYAETLRFLGLAPDGRTEFPVAIPHWKPRSWLANRLALRPSRIRKVVGDALRKILGVESLGFSDLMLKLNNTTRERQPVSDDLHQILVDHFKDDIDLLSRLLGRDLSHWYKSGTPSR